MLVFDRKFIALTVLITLVLGSNYANAMKSRIGVIGAANTKIIAKNAEGIERELKIGDDIYFNETLRSNDTGNAQLLFIDKSVLTIGKNSSIKVDKFVYNPITSDGSMVLRTTKGTFRFIGGALSKKEHVIIKTPVGTMGIRGSTANIMVEPNGQTTVQNIFSKEMTLENNAGEMAIITTQGASAILTRGSQTPVETVSSQAQILSIQNQLFLAGNAGAKALPTEQMINADLVTDSNLGADYIPAANKDQSKNEDAGGFVLTNTTVSNNKTEKIDTNSGNKVTIYTNDEGSIFTKEIDKDGKVVSETFKSRDGSLHLRKIGENGEITVINQESDGTVFKETLDTTGTRRITAINSDGSRFTEKVNADGSSTGTFTDPEGKVTTRTVKIESDGTLTETVVSPKGTFTNTINPSSPASDGSSEKTSINEKSASTSRSSVPESVTVTENQDGTRAERIIGSNGEVSERRMDAKGNTTHIMTDANGQVTTRTVIVNADGTVTEIMKGPRGQNVTNTFATARDDNNIESSLPLFGAATDSLSKGVNSYRSLDASPLVSQFETSLLSDFSEQVSIVTPISDVSNYISYNPSENIIPEPLANNSYIYGGMYKLLGHTGSILDYGQIAAKDSIIPVDKYFATFNSDQIELEDVTYLFSKNITDNPGHNLYKYNNRTGWVYLTENEDMYIYRLEVGKIAGAEFGEGVLSQVSMVIGKEAEAIPTTGRSVYNFLPDLNGYLKEGNSTGFFDWNIADNQLLAGSDTIASANGLQVDWAKKTWLTGNMDYENSSLKLAFGIVNDYDANGDEDTKIFDGQLFQYEAGEDLIGGTLDVNQTEIFGTNGNVDGFVTTGSLTNTPMVNANTTISNNYVNNVVQSGPNQAKGFMAGFRSVDNNGTKTYSSHWNVNANGLSVVKNNDTNKVTNASVTYVTIGQNAPATTVSFGGTDATAASIDDNNYALGQRNLTDGASPLGGVGVLASAHQLTTVGCSSCDYVHWGVWASQENTASPTVDNVAEMIPYVAGTLTENVNIPSNLSATYTGTVVGSIYNDSLNSLENHIGALTAHLNIVNGSATISGGALDIEDFGGYSLTNTANVPVVGGRFNGALTVSSGGSGAGSFNGALFGPAAENVAGNFEFSTTDDNITGTGVYLGARPE